MRRGCSHQAAPLLPAAVAGLEDDTSHVFSDVDGFPCSAPAVQLILE